MEFFSHRKMSSCGFHTLLSARNGYVVISSVAFTTNQAKHSVFCCYKSHLWVSLIRPPKLRSARCSHPCLLYIQTSQVQYIVLHLCNNAKLKERRSKNPRWWCHLQIWHYQTCAYMSSFTGLWIMAAKSELEDRDSSESARHLFLRALRFHPNSKKVYQEVKQEKSLIPLLRHDCFSGNGSEMLLKLWLVYVLIMFFLNNSTLVLPYGAAALWEAEEAEERAGESWDRPGEPVAQCGKCRNRHKHTHAFTLCSVPEYLLFQLPRANMSFLQRSWVLSWPRLCTEMLQRKSKVGNLQLFLCKTDKCVTLQFNFVFFTFPWNVFNRCCHNVDISATNWSVSVVLSTEPYIVQMFYNYKHFPLL